MSRTSRNSLAVPDESGLLEHSPVGWTFVPPTRPTDRVEMLRPERAAGFSFRDLAPEKGENEDLYDEGDADEDRDPDQVLVAWFTDDAGFRWQLDGYLHLVNIVQERDRQAADESTYRR